MSVEIIRPVLLVARAGTEEVAEALVTTFLKEHAPDYEQEPPWVTYIISGRTDLSGA